MTIEIAHGVPHVRILPLAAPLALDIAFGEPPPLSDAVAAAWAHRTAANPRLFDGPLLHVSSIDAELGRISVHVAAHRHDVRDDALLVLLDIGLGDAVGIL